MQKQKATVNIVLLSQHRNEAIKKTFERRIENLFTPKQRTYSSITESVCAVHRSNFWTRHLRRSSVHRTKELIILKSADEITRKRNQWTERYIDNCASFCKVGYRISSWGCFLAFAIPERSWKGKSTSTPYLFRICKEMRKYCQLRFELVPRGLQCITAGEVLTVRKSLRATSGSI